MIRDKIRNYFKNRECVCMVRPIAEENRLANLEFEKWEDLRSAFRYFKYFFSSQNDYFFII